MANPAPSGRIAILLSTYDGAAFLPEQLASLEAQTHDDWVLFWRDDASHDESSRIMEAFADRTGRVIPVPSPEGHVGATASFMTLLRTAAGQPFAAIAFADQDDVWLAEKLARGLTALEAEGAHRPVIYCARQILVDAALNRIGLSHSLPRRPGFPASLTQNVATGCTVMLNPEAAQRIARSRPSPASLHDWWCYLLVTAAGGAFVMDDEPVVLYRQHPGNLVGAPASKWRRGIAAIRRGPRLFMSVLRQNLDALAEQPELLAPEARLQVDRLRTALRGGMVRRLGALGLPGLQRQTWLETQLFRLWFLIG
jgi:glycosyltransferase involved in cell wall biosynthesis